MPEPGSNGLMPIGASLLPLLAAGVIRAASLNTESFDTGFSGWTNNIDTNKWVATSQLVRVSFPSSMSPLTASLEAGPSAAGGAFSGDFFAAGIEAIGLSFLAETVRPNHLKIEVASGTNVMVQDLLGRLGPTGTWNHIICPLAGPDAARWTGVSASGQAGILTNVSLVALRVETRGVFIAQSYRLDDIFLDRLPAATALSMTDTNVVRIQWTHLRTNFTYRIESASVLTDSWSGAETITATNTEALLDVTNTMPESPSFHRLQLP